MSPKRHAIRTPVRRAHADRYLLIALLVFVAAVSITRVFLNLADYPQIGGGEFHIAHLLWGGLLLFMAALLPLLFSNRWVYPAGAVLAGAGVGLFIDEVGKFITRSNDYFYPAAAPIIYTFFLLILFVYFQVRRPPSRDPRTAFYSTLEDLQEVLDHDLEPAERAEIEAKLTVILRNTSDDNYARLATALIQFLRSNSLQVTPAYDSFLERLGRAWDVFEKNHITRGRWRAALAGGWLALGALLLTGFLRILIATGSEHGLYALVSNWIMHGMVRTPFTLVWFLAQVTLEGAAGTLFIFSAILLFVRAERPGLAFGILGLLINLAGINLLSFYFDQFSAIVPAAIEMVLLVSALRFRRAYLAPSV